MHIQLDTLTKENRMIESENKRNLEKLEEIILQLKEIQKNTNSIKSIHIKKEEHLEKMGNLIEQEKK